MLSNKILRLAVIWSLLCVVALAGCYRATVQTGLAPSGVEQTIWAHSWLFGLVPPAVINAQSECQTGVAQVETSHSFVNQLLAFVTWGIYTPITVEVTCAKANVALHDSSAVVAVANFADYAEVMAAFSDASQLAADGQTPAYVVFEAAGSE